jgi:hypothetical protein
VVFPGSRSACCLKAEWLNAGKKGEASAGAAIREKQALGEKARKVRDSEVVQTHHTLEHFNPQV